MPKPPGRFRKRPHKPGTDFAREIAGMPPDRPDSGQVRQPNGIVAPHDATKEVLVATGNGTVTITKPLPSRAELQARIKDLTPRQALSAILADDVANGDFLKIVERWKAMAKGGDFRSIEEYLSRSVGAKAQSMSIGVEFKASFSAEDRQALDSIRSLFGMAALPAAAPKAEVVADSPAKEVA